MQHFDKDKQTIVAISTSKTSAAIGIIRLSGSFTLDILKQICRTVSGNLIDFENQPRRQIHCHFHVEDNLILDDAIVSYYKSPSSYTSDDMAELCLHGNPLLLRKAVQILLDTGLCRPADPGEFTRRAYLSGRIDLTQAEAVHRIITARSELELEASRKNLSGELTKIVSNLRSSMIHLKAETEAEIDFSTEDLSFESRNQKIIRIKNIQSIIKELISRGDQTKHLRSGFQVTLLGVPNSGKSSLFNSILGWDRAIVSEKPGTTRDYLSEELILEGVPVRFVDSAGLRKSEDEIEKQGMLRSLKNAEQSQLILHIIDGERELYDLPEMPKGIQILFLVNKNDSPEFKNHLESLPQNSDVFEISCKTKAGMDALKKYLHDFIFQFGVPEEPLLLEDRHKYHFNEIIKALEKATSLLNENAPEEIVILEINQALDHAGKIVGHIGTEEVLGRIFSVFCVGK